MLCYLAMILAGYQLGWLSKRPVIESCILHALLFSHDFCPILMWSVIKTASYQIMPCYLAMLLARQQGRWLSRQLVIETAGYRDSWLSRQRVIKTAGYQIMPHSHKMLLAR